MDSLRSHMLARARMIRMGSQQFWIRWYPCAPTAKPLPLWTCFGSPVWEDANDDVDDFLGCGVFRQGQEWRGKRYPAPPGLHFHGSEEDFLFGIEG